MKLLVVSHACAAPVNQELYAAVQRVVGWDISIVVPEAWNDEYGQTLQAQAWPQFRGKLIPVPVRKSGNIVLHTYRCSFAKLIREENPDVVYVNHEPYAAATAQVYWGNTRAGGRPLRRPIGFYTAQNIAKRYPPPFRWTESWVLRSSQYAFPVSHQVDRVFRNKGYTGVSEVLPLAIDPAVYYRRDDAAHVRNELLGPHAPADAMLLGYLGRLVPEKGLRTLFQALVLIRELPWRLALVGAGSMDCELRHLATQLNIADRVHFQGVVPHTEAPRMLSAFDVLVLPSETQSNWREQFGRVLLEAMACGTPVVGTNSGEIPVLIERTGGGVLAAERNAPDLAQKLRRMILDAELRSRRAAAGCSAVNEHFTVDQAALRFVRTIEQCVQSRYDPTAVPLEPANA